jgi:hypothetical protein
MLFLTSVWVRAVRITEIATPTTAACMRVAPKADIADVAIAVKAKNAFIVDGPAAPDRRKLAGTAAGTIKS